MIIEFSVSLSIIIISECVDERKNREANSEIDRKKSFTTVCVINFLW